MTMNAYRSFAHNLQGLILLVLAYLCFKTHVELLGYVATTLASLSFVSHWIAIQRLVYGVAHPDAPRVTVTTQTIDP